MSARGFVRMVSSRSRLGPHRRARSRCAIMVAVTVSVASGAVESAAAGEVLEVAMDASRAVTRSSANAFDAFGAAIAGDGARVLVGCRGCDLAGANAGAVFAYSISAERRLVETQAILPSDSRLRSEFGHAVAMLGSTVSVGVPRGGDGGAVGILVERGGVFSESQVVERSVGVGSPEDEFGAAVALGIGGRLAVGAPGATVGAVESAGLVEIHTLAGGVYGYTATLTAPTPAEGERFGTAVALSGSWLAVGAPFDDGAGEDAGAVHVYRYLSTGQWTFAATLRPPAGEVIGAFGRRLAFDGDTLAVGAPRLDSAGPDRGAVFLYRRVASLWIEDAILTPPGSPAGSDFGDSLSLVGALLVVGAPSDSADGVGSGAAYVYERGATGWEPIVRLESVATGYSFLGTSVAVADGMVAVGAPFDSSTANYAGSVFQLDLLTDCDGSGVADALETAADPSLDTDGDGVLDVCEPCRADLDGDGMVGGSDLGLLLIRWATADASVDLDGNGAVDGADIGILLIAWGPC